MKQRRCFKCHKPARLQAKLCLPCRQVAGVFEREVQRQETLNMLRNAGWVKR